MKNHRATEEHIKTNLLVALQKALSNVEFEKTEQDCDLESLKSCDKKLILEKLKQTEPSFSNSSDLLSRRNWFDPEPTEGDARTELFRRYSIIRENSNQRETRILSAIKLIMDAESLKDIAEGLREQYSSLINFWLIVIRGPFRDILKKIKNAEYRDKLLSESEFGIRNPDYDSAVEAIHIEDTRAWLNGQYSPESTATIGQFTSVGKRRGVGAWVEIQIGKMPEKERWKFLEVQSGDGTYYKMIEEWRQSYNKEHNKNVEPKKFRDIVSREKHNYKKKLGIL